MRNYRDAKAMAQTLRDNLKTKDVTLSVAESLELISKQFGLDNWNVLAAKIAEEPPADAKRFVQTCPIMRIFDEARARDFYIDYLGFKVDFEHRFAAGMPLYMGISRDGLILHLSEHYGDGTPGHRIYLRMRGMRAFHAELLSRPGHGQNPAVNEEAPGGPALVVGDPFGNSFLFTEAP